MITVIDYGVGNLGSIINMFRKIGVDAKLTNNAQDIIEAEKLLLPGVGSFDYGMQMLNNSGYIPLLKTKVLEQKTPILGICLGMQLLSKRSDEGTSKGLGFIDAETVKFNVDTNIYKVPHMGWAEVVNKKMSKLFNDMYDEPRFYFVHSYHMKCNDTQDVLLTANYGYEFVCGIEKDNIYGVQFHPEKSHKFGMKLLENFAKI